MLMRPFGRWIGFCAAACVMALFFFPLVHGPFQATHGPTTAFRGRRAFLGIIRSILRAALSIFAAVLVSGARQFTAGLLLYLDAFCNSSSASPGVTVLRC